MSISLPAIKVRPVADLFAPLSVKPNSSGSYASFGGLVVGKRRLAISPAPIVLIRADLGRWTKLQVDRFAPRRAVWLSKRGKADLGLRSAEEQNSSADDVRAEAGRR